MNLQAQKALIIEQFKQVDDINLINAVKNLLDAATAKEKQSDEISQAHQKIVLDRFDRIKNNPDRLLDWEEAQKTLKV